MIPTYENAAGLIESYAASGVTVPYGIYELQRTVTLPAGSVLKMAPQCELRVAHSGTGLDVTGAGVTIEGGTISGAITLSDWSECAEPGYEGVWEHAYAGVDPGYGYVAKLRDLWVSGERRYVCKYPAGWDYPDTLEDGGAEYVQMQWFNADPSCYAATYSTPLNNTKSLATAYDGVLEGIVPTGSGTDVNDIDLCMMGTYYASGAKIVTVTATGGLVTFVTQADIMPYNHYNDVNRFWLENMKASLPLSGNEGAWCHDRENGRILYKPTEVELSSGVGNFECEVAECRRLVECRGSSGDQSSLSMTGCRLRFSAHFVPDNGALFLMSSMTTGSACLKASQYVSSLELDGVLFDNVGQGAWIGHRQDDGIRGHMRNCRMTGSAARLLLLGYPSESATSDYGAVDFVVSNNVFHSNGWVRFPTGLATFRKHVGTVISNNIVRGAPFFGMQFASVSGNPAPETVVSGNEFCYMSFSAGCDCGAVYSAETFAYDTGDAGMVISDNYFHHNNLSEGTYLHDDLKIKVSVYLEFNHDNINVRDNLFTDADGWHMHVSQYSNNDTLFGNTFAHLPAGYRSNPEDVYNAEMFVRPSLVNYGAVGVAAALRQAWYEDVRSEPWAGSYSSWNFTFTGVVDNGSSATVSFAARTKASMVVGDDLVGKYLLVLTEGGTPVASTDAHWYKVVAVGESGVNVVSLTIVDADDESTVTIGGMTSGDFAVLCNMWTTEDNVFIGSPTDDAVNDAASSAAALAWYADKLRGPANWRLLSDGTYGPLTPDPDDPSGPECWFDFPENSPMIPTVL